jgi:ubiquinone biosynthesis protein
MGALLEEFFAKLRRHRLSCPADIVYLIKAITTIEGVAEQVCPEFDLVGHVRPHVEGLVKRRFGFKAVRNRLQSAALGYAELAEGLPREARALSKMLRNEQLIVRLRHQGLDRVTDEIERASRNISLALVIAALLVGGTILLLAQAVGGDPYGLLTAAAVISISSAIGISLYWMITRSWS